MGDTSAIDSIENTTKTITRLPRYLRSKFYGDFKNANLNNQSLNLATFEIWIVNKVTELFNPISAIIDHQKKNKKGLFTKIHTIQKEIKEILTAREGMSNNQPNLLQCWLYSKDHNIAEFNQL